MAMEPTRFALGRRLAFAALIVGFTVTRPTYSSAPEEPGSTEPARGVDTPTPRGAVPAMALEGCTGAGYAPGSAEFDQCVQELLDYMKRGRKPTPAADVTPARLAPHVNIPALCFKYYSKELRVARAAGAVALFFYVGVDGRVKEVLIRESSGLPLLDAATSRCIVDKGVRFMPQMDDGVPVGSWESLKYTWHAP